MYAHSTTEGAELQTETCKKSFVYFASFSYQ